MLETHIVESSAMIVEGKTASTQPRKGYFFINLKRNMKEYGVHIATGHLIQEINVESCMENPK